MFAEHALDEIVIADRSAAGGDQQVGPGRAGDQALQPLAIVGGDAEVDRLGPTFPQEGDEALAV